MVIHIITAYLNKKFKYSKFDSKIIASPLKSTNTLNFVSYIYVILNLYELIKCNPHETAYPINVVYAAAIYPNLGMNHKFNTMFVHAATLEINANHFCFLQNLSTHA